MPKPDEKAATEPRAWERGGSWIETFKGGPPNCGDFTLGGPISDAFNLAAVSLRLGGKRLLWDAAATVTFTPEGGGKFDALVTVVTTLDGSDVLAAAKKRLAAAEAAGFEGTDVKQKETAAIQTFDHEKDELTGWLNGVSGDRWLENPKNDQLISSAWIGGVAVYGRALDGKDLARLSSPRPASSTIDRLAPARRAVPGVVPQRFGGISHLHQLAPPTAPRVIAPMDRPGGRQGVAGARRITPGFEQRPGNRVCERTGSFRRETRKKPCQTHGRMVHP